MPSLFEQQYQDRMTSGEFEVVSEPPNSSPNQSSPPQSDSNWESDEEFDILDEVERKLALASYYKILAQGNLFEGDTSPEASQIDREIRQFCRERMGELVGTGTKPVTHTVSNQFSPDEVNYLKAFVAKGRTIQTNAPVVKKFDSPVKPTLPTPPRPILKTDAKPKASQEAKQVQPRQKKKVSKAEDVPNGQKFTENGKTYVWIDDPMKHKDAETGQTVRIKRDITPAVVNPLSVPMPSITRASEIRANEIANAASSGSLGPLLGKLLG